MAFDSVQDYTLSSVLPISQPGFASNVRRVQDEDDGDDALDSVPTPAQGLKRPEPVSEGGVEDNTSDEDEEVPSIGRPASTPQPPMPKPTSPVPGRSADGGTQKHTTASIRPKPTPQTKHSETPIHDNIFFRVARILLAVAVVMAVLYLVYWVATNVYGVDVLGWTHVFSREGEGESGMSASIPSAEQAFTADVPSLMVQESTSTTAPEVRTPTTGNTADVDSSRHRLPSSKALVRCLDRLALPLRRVLLRRPHQLLRVHHSHGRKPIPQGKYPATHSRPMCHHITTHNHKHKHHTHSKCQQPTRHPHVPITWPSARAVTHRSTTRAFRWTTAVRTNCWTCSLGWSDAQSRRGHPSTHTLFGVAGHFP